MRTPNRLAVALVALAAGCSSRTAAPPAGGRRIVEGPALLAAPSPDGARVAWLSGCAQAPGGPAAQAGCRLLVAPLAGGAPSVVAEGLAPAPGSFAWGPDGALAALARRDAAGAGDLVVARGAGEPRVLARGVTAFAFGPGSELGLVAGGDLLLAPPGGDAVPLAGGTGAGAFAFAPAPSRALAALVRGPGGAWQLALWRGAGGPPSVVARDAGAFAFSSDGAWLAAIGAQVPGAAGDLLVVPVPGDAPAAPAGLAKGVGEFRWAPGAPRLAWLASVDARIRAGTLVAAPAGGLPVLFGAGVTGFELAPGGGQVAYVQHVTVGGYSANLMLSPAQGLAAGKVASGAAGFEFSPDGRWLWYRATCAPAGDSCALYRAPAAGLGPSQAPERIAEGTTGVVLDPVRPDRALVTFARADGAGVDLAAWAEGKVTALDAGVVPGSARFVPPDGRRVLYAVAAPGRIGLHVVDVP
jgi:hypothetical protein